MTKKLVFPKAALYDTDINDYVEKCSIPNFRLVAMRDGLPKQPNFIESGIINLDDTRGSGTHWCCWFKQDQLRIYFDSYGLKPPQELINYLKTPVEIRKNLGVIRCNAIVVQRYNTYECGSLCLYVLYKLAVEGESFSRILNTLSRRCNSKKKLEPLVLEI